MRRKQGPHLEPAYPKIKESVSTGQGTEKLRLPRRPPPAQVHPDVRPREPGEGAPNVARGRLQPDPVIGEELDLVSRIDPAPKQSLGIKARMATPQE